MCTIAIFWLCFYKANYAKKSKAESTLQQMLSEQGFMKYLWTSRPPIDIRNKIVQNPSKAFGCKISQKRNQNWNE